MLLHLQGGGSNPGCKDNHFSAITSSSEGKMRDLFVFLTKKRQYGV